MAVSSPREEELLQISGLLWAALLPHAATAQPCTHVHPYACRQTGIFTPGPTWGVHFCCWYSVFFLMMSTGTWVPPAPLLTASPLMGCIEQGCRREVELNLVGPLRCVSYEALENCFCLWNNPGHSRVPPFLFIPLSAPVAFWTTPAPPRLIQESARLGADGPARISARGSSPAAGGTECTLSGGNPYSQTAWRWKWLILTESSHRIMFLFCLGAAYEMCPEFILMNEGPLWCCSSVIAAALINHQLVVSRTGITKYIELAAQDTQYKDRKKESRPNVWQINETRKTSRATETIWNNLECQQTNESRGPVGVKRLFAAKQWLILTLITQSKMQRQCFRDWLWSWSPLELLHHFCQLDSRTLFA